jgi:hypothetical protein
MLKSFSINLLLLLIACAPLAANDLATKDSVSFELEIQPILAARGCSKGACHGKARGQNGFQLSLLGFDSDFDYAALTKNARGRRIFFAAPKESLLLRKASAKVPHGGGERLAVGSDEYQTVLRWIESGAPRRRADEPTLAKVEVTPESLFMRPNQETPLRVTAHYSDGSVRDVTNMAVYQSNESAVVKVDDGGRMTAGPLPGESAIMARYMNVFSTCRVMIPLEGEVPDNVYQQLPVKNFIDSLVWKKLAALGITPSEAADDTKFMRRAYVDVIGTLPTPAEAREFIEDDSVDKRARLIDRLLDRPEYAEHWANKWVDLLRPNAYRVGIKAVLNYDFWIRDAFRKNIPYDEFVRKLVTARGSTWHNGAVTLFRDRRSPNELTTIFTQLFLGIRLECAKCHHHPFEKWGQTDYYQFAAFFSRVGRKGSGLSPPISGGEEMVLTSKKGEVKHPISGAALAPQPLFGELAVATVEDPRDALAEWMTSDENPFFAQVMANRIWADLMGLGLVEPIDDLRATNPASNGELLQELGADFQRKKYDVKELIRTITSSYVYGLSSLPTERNVADTRNYSRHYRRRLRAEVLMDAISGITEVPDSFAAMPAGSTAKEIWTHRVGSLFLDTFGRPDPNQDPPCERMEEATVTQALHMMNAVGIHAKVISDEGRAARLTAAELPARKIVEELYLAVYARLPDEVERSMARVLFEGSETPRRAAEDLLWALLNTPEFLFKD